MNEVLEKCEEKINSFRKKKKVSHLFKKIILGARSVIELLLLLLLLLKPWRTNFSEYSLILVGICSPVIAYQINCLLFLSN